MGFPIVKADPSLGNMLGGAIAQGIGQFSESFEQGLSTQLNQMLEYKKNATAASNFSDYLGLKGDAKKNFIGTFSGIPAKDQLGAFQKLMEAQALQQYLGQGMNQGIGQETPQGFMQQQNPHGMGQGIMSGLGSSQEPLDPAIQDAEQPLVGGPSTQQQAAPKRQAAKPQVAGFEFEPEELDILRRPKPVPPIGGLQKAAELQDKQLRENRERLDKYSSDYSDVTKLRQNVNDLKEASRIINKVDPSVARKLALAILEDNESSVATLLKTADEQKLFSLLRDSIKAKQEGGSNPSTRELMISLRGIPDIKNKKEANQAIVSRLLHNAETNLGKAELINGIRSKNPSADPDRVKELVESKIEKKFGKGVFQTEETIRIETKDGRKGSIPKSNLKKALKEGAKQI